MREQVRIFLSSGVSGEDLNEFYEYDGSYRVKNGKEFILYEEILFDGTMAPAAIRIEDNKIAVLRNEKAGGHMVFDPEHRQRVHFQTPFGDMKVRLNTLRADRYYHEDKIVLKMEYGLRSLPEEETEADFNGEDDTIRVMQIRIENKE